MELQFLGRGAAFNPKEGNNSAFPAGWAFSACLWQAQA